MKVKEAGLRIRPWGLNTARSDLVEVHEDLVFMIRRAGYVQDVRHVALGARRTGWAALLAGAGTLAWSATRGPGVDSAAAYSGEVAIALGWLLFVYVMVKRTRYVRAHPFKPNR
jgi:hypothetical protein